MAQLKDLIVNGASQLIGDVTTNNIQITTLKAPISSNNSTYGVGGQGQALFSNGNSIYWDVIPQTVTDAMVGSWGYGKITSVSGTNGLTGSGSSGAVTISHAEKASGLSDLTESDRRYVKSLTFDEYGHITGYTTGTETVEATTTLDATNITGLASVATTGSYNNLNDKPNLNFLPLTGGEVTDDITLKANANTDSPAIIFQRGTLSDDYNDWKVYDSGGYLYFGQRSNESTNFDKSIYFDTSGNIHANLQGNASRATVATSVQAKLTIGTYEYNGSSAVNVPIYDGTISPSSAQGVEF